LESGFGDPERIGGEDGGRARASSRDYVRERVVPVLLLVVVLVTTACAALSIAILAIEATTRRFAPALPPMLPISQIRVPLPPLSKHVLQIPVRGKIHPPIR